MLPVCMVFCETDTSKCLKIPRGVIRSHKSKDSQYNGKQQKDNIYKTLNRKLNIEQHEPISQR